MVSFGWLEESAPRHRFVEDVKDGRLSVAVVGEKITQNLMSFSHPVTILW